MFSSNILAYKLVEIYFVNVTVALLCFENVTLLFCFELLAIKSCPIGYHFLYDSVYVFDKNNDNYDK